MYVYIYIYIYIYMYKDCFIKSRLSFFTKEKKNIYLPIIRGAISFIAL